MKTLLIPTDFSETSEAAIDFGMQLAERHGYDVILQHSVEFVPTYEAMYIDAINVRSFTQEIVEDCEIRLDNLVRKHNQSQVKVTKRLMVGSLISDLQSLVKVEQIDLIVMGTRGASGLKEFFVGSNTEKVVRLVNCPVISIPEKTKFKEVRKILVPVDMRELRPKFLNKISKFQQLFAASIEFIWVKTPHSIESSELVTDALNSLLSKYEIASSSFSIIRDIFPDEGIIKYSKESDADMIAMATHARRGLAHLFSGSLTEDVLNHLNIPLWSFKLDESEDIIDLVDFQDFQEMSK
ncbi:MAG: universal stress protein [Cytophagales bacterium]|nr:universal stress protein [Cytophagales bacterium]